MRIRQVKPDFWKHVGLGELSRDARLLFIALWGMADCSGRLQDHPLLIKAEAFPFDDITSKEVDEWINEIANHPENFITRYEVDGKKYIQVNSFNKHQHLMGNESKATSKYPEPNSNDHSKPVRTNPYLVSDSTTDNTDIRSNGNTDKPKSEKFDCSDDFSIWWKEYPKSDGKKPAYEAYKKARKKVSAEVLLEAAKNYAAKVKRDRTESKFIKMAQGWLNEERWENDYSIIQAGSATGNYNYAEYAFL